MYSMEWWKGQLTHYRHGRQICFQCYQCWLRIKIWHLILKWNGKGCIERSSAAIIREKRSNWFHVYCTRYKAVNLIALMEKLFTLARVIRQTGTQGCDWRPTRIARSLRINCENKCAWSFDWQKKHRSSIKRAVWDYTGGLIPSPLRCKVFETNDKHTAKDS